MDDWQDLMDYPRLLKVADFSYFYILFSYGLMDRQTYIGTCYVAIATEKASNDLKCIFRPMSSFYVK